MDKRYKDIPSTGKYRGPSSPQAISQNVRAQMPPDPDQAHGRPVATTYQFLFSETKGAHRVRVLSAEDAPEPMTGYTELGRYVSEDELRGALGGLQDTPRYVVFENRKSGEVFYDAESNVRDNWTGDGRFDVITIFDDETEAAAYADRRQREMGIT